MKSLESALWLALAAALSLPVATQAQHAGHGQTATPSSTMTQADESAEQPQVDHASMEQMETGTPQTDHLKHRADQVDHSQMDRSQNGASQIEQSQAAPTSDLREPIPPVTDAERAAAFPPLKDHHKHGTSLNAFWLTDQWEGTNTDEGREIAWEGIGWIGSDINRLWLRTKGHTLDESLQRTRVEALYGRAFHRWWDAIIGVRRDFGDIDGDETPRTWAAFGIQGLALYKFEVSATGYVGERGKTAAILEAEYDMLLTNRLIANWSVEADWFGQSDPEEVIGAGLSTVEAGVRLRYEITRQFAPYVGFEREWSYGKTADLRGLSSHSRNENRWVIGLRFWF
jgi:copper resistance protein B